MCHLLFFREALWNVEYKKMNFRNNLNKLTENCFHLWGGFEPFPFPRLCINVKLQTLSWRQSNTFTSALPGDDDYAPNSFSVTQIHHPNWIIHVIVVENGASSEVGVFISIHCIRGVAILPTHPWMSFIIHPSVPFVSKIFNYKEIQILGIINQIYRIILK